ncbi:MAG: tetratricopeptide repeat-containing sensor histidine kinase [Chryseolinea sp.]
MKNIFLVLLVSLFTFTQILAQSKADSLRRVLNNNPSDSVKVRTLIALSSHNQYVDFRQARVYADEALSLATKLEDLPTKVAAYQNKAVLLTMSGDYSAALRYDNLTLENDILLKDSTNISRDYNNIGNDYYDLGEYDDAFFYFSLSHRIATAAQDTFRMLVADHNVGRVFKEMGQYETAVEHLLASKRLSDHLRDEEGLAYTFDELGDVQLRRQQYDSAERSLSYALKVARKGDYKVVQPRIYGKLATVSFRKGAHDRALAFYDTAYHLNEQTTDRHGMAEVDLGRAVIFTSQKRYDQALINLENSLTVAKELNARILEIKCYNQLSQLWEMKADYQKSLLYYKQYKQLEDSLFSQELQGKLLRSQLRFETEARDSQIALLSQKDAHQSSELRKQEFVRNILAVVMALSVILLISVYRSGRRRRQINTLLLQHQEEMEKRSEELERLNQVKDKFFSIISHDLRSPINALSGLLDLLDKGAVSASELPKHIKELKARFNHTRTLLNNLLDWTLLQMDKLSVQAAKIDVYNIVEENIQLLTSVQSKDIRLINEVPRNAIGFADSNTINLVIRNLITNAIKFTNDGGTVRIAAREKDAEWLVSVKDNGVGMNNEVLKMLFDKTSPYTTRGTANEKGTGLGLILCKEFVEKNAGRIWVESEEGVGSTFFFTLPKA